MNRTEESKAFFAATEVAARDDARHWLVDQTDISLTTDTTARQTASGGWVVTVVYQRQSKAGQP
jgi:hypothetical protein